MSFPEFSSETAVTMYFWQLIPEIARRLSIPNWQFLAVNEQLDAIGEHSKPAGDALREYLKLYAKWATEARADQEDSKQFAHCQAARKALVLAVEHAAKPSAIKRPKQSRRKAKTAKRHR